MEKSLEEFVLFLREALGDWTSLAHGQLYRFLVSRFIRADRELRGRVGLEQFGTLVDESAALPRLYGLVPKMPAECRIKLFSDLDSEGRGYLTLDRWISFAKSHIDEKGSNSIIDAKLRDLVIRQ